MKSEFFSRRQPLYQKAPLSRCRVIMLSLYHVTLTISVTYSYNIIVKPWLLVKRSFPDLELFFSIESVLLPLLRNPLCCAFEKVWLLHRKHLRDKKTCGKLKHARDGMSYHYHLSCDSTATATNNQQPTTNNLRPTTTNQQPTTNNLRPTTYNLQKTTNNQQPTTNNLQQQTTYIQQPTTNNNLQPTTNNLQPTSNQQPTTTTNLQLTTTNLQPTTNQPPTNLQQPTNN